MKHANISVFIPHIGCPHLCSFCDQRTISGTQKAPTPEDVRELCKKALEMSSAPENTEIAFFGGSFTAIPRSYMTSLLEAVHDLVGAGKFHGIRISTRPDCISREILDILKKYGVTAIELGAQSMCDDVLEANERGHDSAQVRASSELIREYGFELGLQMMVGLYKSSEQREAETIEKIIAIHPDTVRIYPVVILKNTRLGELFSAGEFKPLEFDTVLNICSEAILRFTAEKIKVIKCGLHASEFVEKDMLGGFYHPAFRELCENLIYRQKTEEFITSHRSQDNVYKIAVAPSCISKAIGQKRSNLEYFRSRNITVKYIGDENIPVYETGEVK